MTDSEPKKIYGEICSNLAALRLKPAFDLLGGLIQKTGQGTFYDEYRNLEETYHYMLKYTMEGIQDPERQKVYIRLIVSVFSLADKVNEAIRLRFSSSVEYEKKRTFSAIPAAEFSKFIGNLESFYLQDDAGMSENMKNHQQQVFRLFYHLWFLNNLPPEGADALKDFLKNPLVLVHYKSFLVTALTMSLQRHFDKGKFHLLFDAFLLADTEVNQRALVGLLLNFYRYDARMIFYPSLTGRLKIVSENPGFLENLERIILQLIRSKETEKLQQRIRDEIVPEMIKISPNLKDKINLDSLMEDVFGEDKNPDWQEIFSESPGFIDKMEELSELQMEGADVFMESFAMLKSFPFYTEMGNWFIPFFKENPEIAQALDLSDRVVERLIDSVSRAPVLCNSDKYSFSFSVQSIPKENLDFMENAMKAEFDQMKELVEDEELTKPGVFDEIVSNQYIQDLYRFYKLFPRKNDFEDIFSWKLDFHNSFVLGDILKEHPQTMRNIAEYYFSKNYFDEAAEIFQFLLNLKKEGELYQKIAYCHQKTGDFEKSLENYLKAELYEVNHLWNLKKIALCYRHLKQPDKALEYYQAAERLDPDNLNNQLNIGHCFLELNQYDEALKCYFKVEYLAPGNKKVWRPIAWCSFLTGKIEQAEKYLAQLLEDNPSKHDYMNMGHVQWSLGNRKEALEFYCNSVSKKGFTEEEFLKAFDEDLPHLIDRGINNDDVPIMLDQLRYFLEK